jgi:hypothetical protein
MLRTGVSGKGVALGLGDAKARVDWVEGDLAWEVLLGVGEERKSDSTKEESSISSALVVSTPRAVFFALSLSFFAL